MPRLMSVAYTADAVVERRKTVTRRKGWRFLKVGDRLTLCRKVQGRKPGEPLDRLAEVEVIGVRREPLNHLLSAGSRYGEAEMVREGFPGMAPAVFVDRYFREAQRMAAADVVTRVEWRYVDDVDAAISTPQAVRPPMVEIRSQAIDDPASWPDPQPEHDLDRGTAMLGPVVVDEN